MKKISLLLLIGCANTLAAPAQTPDKAKDVKWQLYENGYRAVVYDMKESQPIVYYDAHGEVEREEYAINLNEAPPPIIGFCKRNYPNELIDQIWVVEWRNGDTSYYVSLNREVLYFDRYGKLSRKIRLNIKVENR